MNPTEINNIISTFAELCQMNPDVFTQSEESLRQYLPKEVVDHMVWLATHINPHFASNHE